MKLKSISTICVFATILSATPKANSQLAYENTHMGESYKVYIYKKENTGSGIWRFKTKTVFRCGYGAMAGCKASPPYISEWQIADCDNSKIDGKTVPASARYGYERGKPEIFRSVCKL